MSCTFRTLLGHKADAFGTVRLGRKGMPPYLKKAELKKGEFIFRRSGQLLALFMTVSMLSTIHDASIVGTGKIDRKWAGKNETKYDCAI